MKLIAPEPLTARDFAEHAQLFGIQDAALMVRNRYGAKDEGFALTYALELTRTFMRGKRIAFKADGGLWQWVAITKGNRA